MKLTLPADAASAITEVSAVAALLDKNGWKAAAFIAVSVKPRAGQGSRTSGTSAGSRVSATAFAKDLNAKGWSRHVIERHYEGWQAAAAAGLVPDAADLAYGDKIDLPDESWSTFSPPVLNNQHTDAEAIQEQAALDGTGASKAVDIAKNPKAMAAAIKASPVVAAAAAQALVDKGDVKVLSRATAAAAQNAQVDRNRKRREAGLPRQATVQNQPTAQETMADSGLAFLTIKSLGNARRLLMDGFAKEWEALSPEARADADLISFCEEGLDQLSIVIDTIRTMVQGGVTDEALYNLLDGAS